MCNRENGNNDFGSFHLGCNISQERQIHVNKDLDTTTTPGFPNLGVGTSRGLVRPREGFASEAIFKNKYFHFQNIIIKCYFIEV